MTATSAADTRATAPSDAVVRLKRVVPAIWLIVAAVSRVSSGGVTTRPPRRWGRFTYSGTRDSFEPVFEETSLAPVVETALVDIAVLDLDAVR